MPTTDTDTDDDVTTISTLDDAKIEALRALAIEDGDTRVSDLCTKALATPMVLGTDADAARRRREIRTQLAAHWTEYSARAGIAAAEPEPTITDAQVRRLLTIATQERDTVLVSQCQRALRATEARRACERVWRERRLKPLLVGLLVALAMIAGACAEVESLGGAVAVPDLEVDLADAPPARAQRLTGRAVSWRGAVVAGATLSVGGEPALVATSAAGGWYALDAVPLGSHVVQATGPGAGYLTTISAVALTADGGPVARDVLVVAAPDVARQYATAGVAAAPGRAVAVADLPAGVPLADVRLLGETGEPVTDAVGPLVVGPVGDVLPAGPTHTEEHGGRSRVAFLNAPSTALSLSVRGVGALVATVLPRPRLAFEVGGSVRAALAVPMYLSMAVRVLAIDVRGTASDVTELTMLATSDALAVSVAGPGRAETASPRAATLTAAFSGHEGGSLAVTVQPRHCAPVIDAVAPAGVRIANPCTIAYGVEGWRVAHRGPAADGQEATLATLAGELAPGASRLVAGPGEGPSGAVALIAVWPHGTSVVDRVGFGALAAAHLFAEGAPAPTLTTAGLSRRGSWDSDDNAADFALGGGQ